MSEQALGTQTLWLDRLLRCALLLCCGMALSKALADPDFWGHVQYARDAMADGLPTESSYSYTAVGHSWINHENFAEIAFAVGVDYLGPSALLIFKCLAGMGALALILRQADRRGVGQVAAYTGAMLVAGNMMLFWTLRPQLFSFIYFVVMLACLEQAFAGWNPRSPDIWRHGWRLLPLVPLMVLWTNTHGGFLAGFAVLSAYLFLRGVEASGAIAQEKKRQDKSRQRGIAGVVSSVPQLAAVLGGIVVLCGAATLINPYGIQLHQWLLRSLGEARPEIIEWRPPEFTLPWLPFWGLATAIIAATAFSQQKRDWVQLAVVGLTLWQSLEHRRHVVFLSLLFGYWMLPHWDSLLKRLQIGRDERTIGESLEGGAQTSFGFGLIAVVALLAVSLFTQVRRIPVRHDSYPVDAFQFIEDHQLNGKLLVQLRWGQYAIAAFGRDDSTNRARLDVAFDGRFRTCYPQHVVDRYFDFAEGVDSPFRNRSENSPPPDERSILNDEPRPDFVLIERAWPNPVRIMQSQQDDWVLVYQDPLCQLFGRRDQCDNPRSKNYVPLEAREVRAMPLTEITAWPALPKSTNGQSSSKSPMVVSAPKWLDSLNQPELRLSPPDLESLESLESPAAWHDRPFERLSNPHTHEVSN